MEMTENISSHNILKPFIKTVLYGAVVYGAYSLFFLFASRILSAYIYGENPAGQAGTIFCLSTLAATFPALAILLLLMGKTKKNRETVFGLFMPSQKKIVFWGVMALFSLGVYDGITFGWHGGIVPEPVVALWNTTHPRLLFFMVFFCAAPIFEELFFRGFLFYALSKSAIGKTGSAVVTAFFWALGHTQYGFWDMGAIFILGMILCFARIQTGSIYPCFFFHLIVNFGTAVELMIFY